MSYSEALAERIRRTSSKRKGVTEKNMSGGVAFLVDGHKFCGIVDNVRKRKEMRTDGRNE